MREILFKGKRKDNGNWAFGGIWREEGVVFIVGKVRYYPDTRDWDTMEYYESHHHYVTSKIRIDPETIGQYTGLVDKNDNKIFEGDIVKTVEGSFKVVCEKGAFWLYDEMLLSNDHLDFLASYEAEAIEVVGNIHDNPELLGEHS